MGGRERSEVKWQLSFGHSAVGVERGGGGTMQSTSPYLQLQALGVAVFTFLRHTLALDCVRSHLVSVSLAEMMFHIVSQIQVYQNVALLLLSIFSFLSCFEPWFYLVIKALK